MSKDDSQMIKGLAILVMIFGHVFANYAGLCDNLVFIGGVPLVQILARAAGPVPYFLIIGGYGLYTVYKRGDKHRYSRLLKLFIHYWIILAIFLVIGHFQKPDVYPGSGLTLLENVTGYETTYNGEMWFLLPYGLLSLISPWVFKLFDRFRALIVVAATLCLYLCTSFCISRFGADYLYPNRWAYNLLCVFHFMFNFSLGAMAARTRMFQRMANYVAKIPAKGIILCGGVIALVAISCVFKYNFFYQFGVVVCFVFAPMPGWVKKGMCKLGNQSMNMWMIHTWLSVYLFQGFIYSFRYPVVIFAVVVGLSYLISLIINRLAAPIERRVMTKAEVKAKPIL